MQFNNKTQTLRGKQEGRAFHKQGPFRDTQAISLTNGEGRVLVACGYIWGLLF